MKRAYRDRLSYILSDGIATSLALLGFDFCILNIDWTLTWEHQVFALLFAFFIYWLSGYYNKVYAKSRFADFSSSLGSSLILTTSYFLLSPKVAEILDRADGYFLSLALLFGLLYLGRSIVTQILLLRKEDPKSRRRILLIKEGKHGEEMMNWLKLEAHLNIAEELTLKAEQLEDKAYISQIGQELPKLAKAGQVEEVVIATQNISFAKISPILYHLYPLQLPIKLSPIYLGSSQIKLRLRSVHGKELINLSSGNMSESSINIKWLIDRLGACLGLIALSPLLLFLAWRVSRSSKGPILFKQERIGYLGRPFKIYKFRSMYTNAEEQGPLLSQDDDPRITPFGRWIRRYRLDELPQLWNVLKGDMSFVGPRPERAFYIKEITKDVPQFFLLHNVRPGITSWAMVKYGYASNLKEMKERLSYDWLYYENMSLRLDLVIIFYTIKTILKGSGK